jgi:hypothetical protein
VSVPEFDPEAVVAALRTAPRIGAEKDQPEGARYIQISDTLAQKMADLIEWLIEVETAKRRP